MMKLKDILKNISLINISENSKNLTKNKIISSTDIKNKRIFDSKLQNTIDKKSPKLYETNSNSKIKFFLNNNFLSSNIRKNSKHIIEQKLTKIEKSFRKIKRIDLICDFRLKFKKNTYLSYLIETRQKIISEENLINHHLYLKKIKTIISDLMDINNIKKTKYLENTFDFGSYKKLTTNLNIME